MPKWRGEGKKAPTIHKELLVTKLAAGEVALAAQTVVQCQTVSPGNRHVSYIIWNEQVMFQNI